MRHRQAQIAIAILLVFRSAAFAGTGHLVGVEAFAGIMADVQTPSER